MVSTASFATPLWTQSVFWVFVAFVIFFALFGRMLWKAVVKMLDARAAAIRAQLEEAEQLKHEAQLLLRDAQTRRAAALAEAEELLRSAKVEAEKMAAELHTEAEAAAKRREKGALERIAAAEKVALNEVRLAAAEIAADAAAKVIAQELSDRTDAQLIDRAIKELPTRLLEARRAA